MEPMDFDVDEPQSWAGGKLQSNISDMEVDTSPLKYIQDSHPERKGGLSSDAILPTNSGGFQRSSSLQKPKHPNRKSTKTGYGIPDDDTTFSHFPEKGSKCSSTKLLHRRVSKLPTVRNERLKSETVRLNSGKGNCFRSCCSLMLNTVKVMMFCGIISLLVLYFLNLQREKCQLSRQFNSKAFKTDLETLVFGQHFASEIIPMEMELYFKKLQNLDPTSAKNENQIKNVEVCKPLVLSFHGWTGVGKNFISKIISDSFTYSVVNHIVIPLHFPHEAFEYKYGQIIQDWLVTNNSDCTVNVVVMDEMDKAFSPVTEGIIGAIEALTQPCHRATPTVILLLSNSYATDINRLFLEHVTQKENRDKMPLTEFHAVFSRKVNDSWHSLFDRQNLIDAYVPFLPLERKHVVQCIKRDLVSKRFSTDSEAVEKILGELTFKSVSGLEISVTGCKRVADKVDYVMLGM